MHRATVSRSTLTGPPADRGDIVSFVRASVERISLVRRRIAERIRYGRVPDDTESDRPVIVVVDGVGRFQFAPYALRRALRELGSEIEVLQYEWQYGLTGEIWTDLLWLRRNRVMGAGLARRLLRLRRRCADRPIHLFALSGGCAIAVFACECLRGREIVASLVLAAPALSAGYNLGPALTAARHCYTLVSRLDRVVLGAGTRLFGTSDRKFVRAAGMIGFDRPSGLPDEYQQGYDRCRQIRWGPSLEGDGHGGGHAGWIASGILRRYLPGLLAGNTELPTETIDDGHGVGGEKQEWTQR